jgi:hypothetical protein
VLRRRRAADLGIWFSIFSSLSVMLRPHVPSMSPASLWPQAPKAKSRESSSRARLRPSCSHPTAGRLAVAAPSGTPGLNAAGYLSPMMLKARTTTTMSTITPPTMTIRVPSALKRMLAGHPQALRSRQPSGCDCLSATRWLSRRFYRPPTTAPPPAQTQHASSNWARTGHDQACAAACSVANPRAC